MKGEEKLREVMKEQRIHDQDRVELQDIIGRRSHAEIKKWYSALEQQERRMFLWIVFSVMGADSAMDIFTKVIAQDFIEKQVRKEEARLSLEWDRVIQRERTVQDSVRTIHRRLGKMRLEKERAEGVARHQLNRLEGAFDRVRHRNDQISQLKESIVKLEDELEEYRIVKQAFAILGR